MALARYCRSRTGPPWCQIPATTPNIKLTRRRSIVDRFWGKSERVFNLHRATFEALAELVGAAGLDHPAQFGPAHFSRRVSANEVRGLIELYPAPEPGELVAGTADNRFEIPWAMASPRQFRAMPLAA